MVESKDAGSTGKWGIFFQSSLCVHYITVPAVKKKWKIVGKKFGTYVVIYYFCTRIRERTAHQHDERGNLRKGDEVRGSKQNSNRHSDSKNFSNFLLKNLVVKKKSLPLQPQSKRKRKFFERFTYQQVVQVLKINTVNNLKINTNSEHRDKKTI